MKWTRLADGKWDPKPSMEDPAKQVGPSPSSHLAWVSADQLRIAELRVGDVLTREEDIYSLKGEALGTDRVIEVERPIDVPIEFQLNGEYFGLTLLEKVKSLAALAKKAKLEVLRATFGGQEVMFSLSNSQWTTRVKLKQDRLPVEMSIMSLRGETVSLPISWSWVARSPGLFVLDEGGEVVANPLASDYSQFKAGIIMESPIPQGLKVNGKWEVRPLTNKCQNGYLGTLHVTNGGDVTLSEVESAVRAGKPSFLGTQFKATVDTKNWLQNRDGYFVVLHNSVRLRPNKKDDGSPVSRFGPNNPYYIGQDSTGIELKELKADGITVEVYGNPDVAAGRLPASHKPGTILIFRAEDQKKAVAGVLTFACEIPRGKWVSVQTLELGSHIVCWRGFVDKASVVSATLDGNTRYALIFENGFELGSNFWFTAPFAGIATTKDAEWWGDAKHSATSRMSYQRGDGKWRVKGRWIRLKPANGVGEPYQAAVHDAAVLPSPFSLVFMCSANAADTSGPILKVDQGGKSPRLIGWLADASGKVQLDGAQPALVNDTVSHFKLDAHNGLDHFEGPLKFREAFEAACNSPLEPEGVLKGVNWCRLSEDAGDVIEVWESTETGVYVLKET